MFDVRGMWVVSTSDTNSSRNVYRGCFARGRHGFPALLRAPQEWQLSSSATFPSANPQDCFSGEFKTRRLAHHQLRKYCRNTWSAERHSEFPSNTKNDFFFFAASEH